MVEPISREVDAYPSIRSPTRLTAPTAPPPRRPPTPAPTFGADTGVAIEAYVEAALVATRTSRPPPLPRARAPRGSEPPSTMSPPRTQPRALTEDEDTGVYLRPFHH